MADFFKYKVPQSYYRRQQSAEKKKALVGINIGSIKKLSVKDDTVKDSLIKKIVKETRVFMEVLLPPEVLDKANLFEEMYSCLFKKLGLK